MQNKISLLAIVICLLSSCAQQVVPTGGKKDEIPPKVISYNPDNKSVNFNQKKIQLKFDEYITIKDPSQIIISPILKPKPTIESDGKEISIEFLQAQPQENTTYTINFSNSITDVNEGNTLTNFSYVFSTGSYIDSNKVYGSIQNTFTNIFEKDILIGLYKKSTFTDTTVFKSFPNYFGKSQENGRFSIENLPEDSFYLVAFKDENSDNKYQKNELVAFAENIIIPAPSSDSINLFMFENPLYKNNKIVDTLSKNKHVYEIVVYKPTDIKITPKTKERYYTKQISGKSNIDTIQVFMNRSNDTIPEIFTIQSPDTSLQVSIKTRNRSKLPIQRIDIKTPEKPTDSVKLLSLLPLDTIYQNRIKFIEDTISITPDYFKKISSFEYVLFHKYKEGKSYSIELLDSATKDIYDRYSSKMSNLFTNKTEKDFGTMDLKILSNQKRNLILQLIEKQGKEEIISQEWISPFPSTLKINYIKPGNYVFKVIDDTNKNGKWDTGNLETKTQAERVFYDKTEINVKAYWDIEQSISIDNLLNY